MSQSPKERRTQRIFGSPRPTAEQILDNLPALREYLNSEPLRIAFAGETSTGKTTLVNALIGDDILTSATDPTTVVPIEAEYGRYFDLVAHFPNGSTESVHGDSVPYWAEIYGLQDDVAQLKDVLEDHTEKLREFTRETSTKDNAERLTVRLPMEFLRHEVTLVDTPGFNSPDEEHRNRAERILESSHVNFLLFTSTQALKGTEKDFLQDKAGHDFTILLTQADRLRMEIDEDEFEEELDGLKYWLAQESRFEEEELIYISALEALEDRGEEGAPYLNTREQLRRRLVESQAESRAGMLWRGLNLEPRLKQLVENPDEAGPELAEQRRLFQRLRDLSDQLGFEPGEENLFQRGLEASKKRAQEMIDRSSELESRLDDLLRRTAEIDPEAPLEKLREELTSIREELREIEDEPEVERFLQEESKEKLTELKRALNELLPVVEDLLEEPEVVYRDNGSGSGELELKATEPEPPELNTLT